MKNKHFIPILILTILCFLSYFRILDNEFVYDDYFQIVHDDYIHNESNFAKIVSLQTYASDIMDRNRPGILLSLMVDALLWGKSPIGFHFTNLLLHTFATILLFLFCLKILTFNVTSKNTVLHVMSALFGASWFAIHPANSEVVCMVTYREDSIVLTGILTALLCFDYVFKKPFKKRYLIGIFISSAVASATKESGFLLPVYLLIYAYFKQRLYKLNSKILMQILIASIIPVVVFLTLYLAMTPDESNLVLSKPKLLGGHYSVMLKIQTTFWGFLLSKVIVPLHLSLEYTSYSLRYFPWLPLLFVLIPLISLVFFFARKNKIVLFSLVFIVLSFIPSSNFIPQFRPIADRFLYVPLGGFAMLICLVIFKNLNTRTKIVSKAVLVLFVLHLSFLAFALQSHLANWETPAKIWSQTLKVSPDNPNAYSSLAEIAYEKGEASEAISLMSKAISVARGGRSFMLLTLAFYFEKAGNHEDAIQALRIAIEQDPRFKDIDFVKRTKRYKSEELEVIQELLKQIKM